MKPSYVIRLAGLVAGALILSASAQAGEPPHDDFYQFARKSAELYRGQLFTQHEMDVFVNEVSHQIQSGAPLSPLNSLKMNPYDVPTTATALQWLEKECQTAKHSSGLAALEKLRTSKSRLEMHYAVLLQMAAAYESEPS